MAIDSKTIELWLLGQLGLGAIWLAKEFFRIFRDQGRKNSEDIGILKTETARLKQDLNSAWARVRLLEADAKAFVQKRPD